MSPINDQETGYSSLSEATPLKIAEPKKSWRRVGVAAAIVSALALAAAAVKTTSAKRGSQPTAFYPLVSVSNSVEYIVSGTVHYSSWLCSDDDFDITPNTAWAASSRGACLIKEITATVTTPDGDIDATPYTSSGTSYSQFAVINHGNGNNFEVTRRVS